MTTTHVHPVLLAPSPYKTDYPALQVPSWGVAVMFVGFLVFTLIWDKALHALEHWLGHRNKVGLLKVVTGGPQGGAAGHGPHQPAAAIH